MSFIAKAGRQVGQFSAGKTGQFSAGIFVRRINLKKMIPLKLHCIIKNQTEEFSGLHPVRIRFMFQEGQKTTIVYCGVHMILLFRFQLN